MLDHKYRIRVSKFGKTIAIQPLTNWPATEQLIEHRLTDVRGFIRLLPELQTELGLEDVRFALDEDIAAQVLRPLETLCRNTG